MSLFLFPLFPLFTGLIAADPGQIGQSVTRLVRQDEIVWRIPVAPRTIRQRLDWVEKKGPKCVPTQVIRRAMLTGAGDVDFILSNRVRVRAKFDDDCPPLDYYAGLYLRPEDGRLCAKRDFIHSRMGGSCEIQTFRRLVATLRD